MRSVLETVNYLRLPRPAKAELQADQAGLPQDGPDTQRALQEAVGWLCRAQDYSRSCDGGVARHFSVIEGWSTSYPETTGYIIPTLLAYARTYRDAVVRRRAKRMLEWLKAIQFPDGSFHGGPVGADPLVPVSFNTGQILFGLAAGVHEFGDYQESLVRAADWLVATQDRDGAWRRYPSPFVAPGEKTYDTHAAWGLLEAARIAPHKPYAEAALANIRWALSFHRENGWIDKCCLSDVSQPLTHALGYALRGMIEAYRFSGESIFLKASLETANGLLTALQDDGFLPGRLDPNWTPVVPWVCLTGTAQIAICWLLLYQMTGEPKYLEAGATANGYIRRTVKIDAPSQIKGGVKGAFPIDSPYNPYQFVNWAAKFFVEANMLEDEIRLATERG